ncbi:esterase/lipase family protein [Rhizobium sp.]
MTTIHTLNDAGDEARATLIFLHGLNGDAIRTWGFSTSGSQTWSDWIIKTEPKLTILSVGYRVRSSRWSGGSMSIFDRSHNILEYINSKKIAKAPIIFVCHSYGGLILKQIIRICCENEKYSYFRERLKAVIFLATPHQGSGIANFHSGLKLVTRSSHAIEELKSNAPYLEDLNRWYRETAEISETNIEVFAESLETSGVLVVNSFSSDPGIRGVRPIKIDCTHEEMARPKFEDDIRVSRLAAIIAKVTSKVDFVSSCSDENAMQFSLSRYDESRKKILLSTRKILEALKVGAPLDERPAWDFETLSSFSRSGKEVFEENLLRFNHLLIEYAAIPRGIGQAVERRRFLQETGMVGSCELIIATLSEDLI